MLVPSLHPLSWSSHVCFYFTHLLFFGPHRSETSSFMSRHLASDPRLTSAGPQFQTFSTV